MKRSIHVLRPALGHDNLLQGFKRTTHSPRWRKAHLFTAHSSRSGFVPVTCYPYHVIMRRPRVAPAMLAALAPMSGCPAGQLGATRCNTRGPNRTGTGRRLVPDRMPGTYGTGRRGAIAVGMGPKHCARAVQLEATRGSSCCTYQASPALTVCRCRSSSTVWWSVARSFSVSATKIPTYERWSLTTSITL